MNIEEIAHVLGQGKERRTSNGWVTICPSHEDSSPSLDLAIGNNGRPVWNCKSGCEQGDVTRAMYERFPELKPAPRQRYQAEPTAVWPLYDSEGRHILDHVRLDRPDGKKDVPWYLPNGYRDNRRANFKELGLSLKNLPLYRGHLMAQSKANVVYLTEGEKDCDALVKAGVEACATVGGANTTPSDAVFKCFLGKVVRLWPDADKQGVEHMQRNAAALKRLGISHEIIDWKDAPPKGGAYDYFAAGGTVEGLKSFPVLDTTKPTGKVLPFPKRDRKAAPNSRLGNTDMGNAGRFARKYRGKAKYCPPRKKWIIFNGTCWFWDETGEIVRMAKVVVREIYREAANCQNKEEREATAAWAHKSESKQRIDAMIALAQSEEGIPVMPHELDADPYLLGVENGVLDLRTRSMVPATPEQLITKQMNASFDAPMKSDLWDSFLKDVTGADAELERYLQRITGYSLFGAVCEKSFWFLYGPPDTGKSRFIGAIKNVFGDYARAVDFSTWCVQTHAGGNRGDLVDLLGARLAVSVEVRRGAKFDEAILKKVTGGDDLKFAAKYEREIEFKPAFALFLAANDAPIIRDDDQGVWTRLCRVPFSRPVPKEKQDIHLEEKLSAHDVKSAILNWAIEGFRQWRENGIGTCAAVDRSNAEYRHDMDRLEGFLDECCEFHPLGKITVKELRDSYEKWAETEGVYPLSAKEFNKRLLEKGCSRTKLNRSKAWALIRLKQNEDNGLEADGRYSKGELFDHASF